MNNINQKVLSFLSSKFETSKVSPEQDIFEGGYVNSLFAMQLVMFIENEFELNIADTDLNIDNFRSINSICSFVSYKSTKEA